jgi:alpha-tubulin suppressor-like RCC1 family protein
VFKESIGQKSEEDVIEPLMIEGDVLNTASGSRYSLIVLRDGSASSSGVVELFDGYRGHLGVDTAVTEGINPLQVISYIYDANATLLDAPAFDKAFAGVESTQGSGIIHSIFLDKMGNAYASGANTQGQLCLGDKEDRFTPTLIPIEGPFIDVAIGGEYTILLHQDGSVFVCGSNEVGQIGLGDDISQTDYPVVLDFLPEVLAVSAGAEHSLFMSTDGIFVTGGNTYGQLCSNSTDFLTTPASLDIPIKDIVSFEATKYSSYILYVDGSVNACGKNDFGQLGDGSNDDKILTEVLVGNVVRLVGTGPASESVFFVGTDETMYASGLNERGNLGVGDTVNRAVPSRVKFGEHVFTDNISPAEDHTILCGLVLGTLPPTDAPSPAPTELITPSPTRQSVGFCFWGASESLGQGNEEDVTRPLYVEEAAVHASAGSRYTLIILQDGSALAGGFVESKDDYQGQFGLGGIVIGGSNDFKVISNVYGRNGTISDAPDFDMAFAGVEHPPESGVMHSVLLDRQGNAYATGSNSKGQLCLGDDEERLIPQQIPMEGRIIDVAIGGEHTLLLHENGTVYVCGSNEVGQIGLGEDVSQTSYPVLLEALSPISSVSAGVEHSLFMSEDGMFVTGDNSYGQLCIDNDGDALFEPGMLDISNSEVTSFEAIRTSTFILHSDGLVNACGRNDMGQLGDGTNETTVFTEVFLDEVEVVRLIGAGPSAESVFFVTKDEVAWGTGSNSRGNLGVGDLQDRNIPTKVRFPNEVLLSSFSAAEDHTVSLCLITGTVIPTVSPTFGATTRTPTFMPSLSPTISKYW